MIARRAHLLILPAALLVGSNLLADTVVDFNSGNLGPSPTLDIGGITVSDLSANQPVTVSGYGLGDVPGPSGTFIISGNNPNSGVNLTVNGIFNSITVLPFAVDQNGTPVALNFALSYELFPSSGGFPIKNIYITGSSGPMTFATPANLTWGSQFMSIDLAAIDNSGGASEAAYINSHPGVTSLTYGYIIEAADVTFNAPDATSTGALLAMSAGVLFAGKRLRRA
jgi:hypothetical protein